MFLNEQALISAVCQSTLELFQTVSMERASLMFSLPSLTECSLVLLLSFQRQNVPTGGSVAFTQGLLLVDHMNIDYMVVEFGCAVCF